MRISDWSSDVCSSDLNSDFGGAFFVLTGIRPAGDTPDADSFVPLDIELHLDAVDRLTHEQLVKVRVVRLALTELDTVCRQAFAKLLNPFAVEADMVNPTRSAGARRGLALPPLAPRS